MAYKITKKVPLPKRTKNRYPFRKMDVGDSFLVTFDDAVNINTVRSAASHFARRTGLARFTVSVEENGLRVFRVA